MDLRKYDVFLSFRVEDTGRNFVDHLYMALKQNGLRAFTFASRSSMHRKGEEVYHICKAIERSRFSIVIFSQNYASSPWCLRELVTILGAKHKLVPIFYHIKPEVLRKQTRSHAKAFAKHQVSNRAEVAEWKQALSIAANLTGWDLNDTTNGSEYKFIDHISKEVRKMLYDEPLHAGFPEHKSKLNNHHSYSSTRLAIFWDMEDCHIPVNVRPEDVAGNILAFLAGQSKIKLEVTRFYAYADFSKDSSKLKVARGRTSMTLKDVPNGSKDACGKAIIGDMFLYALDNPAPSSIMLISGGGGLSNALHRLRMGGYNVTLVIPSRLDVSSTAATNLWEWSNVVHGEGPVPNSRSQIKKNPDVVTKEASIESQGVSMGSQPLSDEPLHAGFQENKYKLNGHYPCRLESRVAIFWDMENCPLPANLSPEHAFGDILTFLGGQTGIDLDVGSFFVYANFFKVSSKIKEGCDGAGMTLIHVSSSKGSEDDECGKGILVDLFLYAKDNPEPCFIMLISKDVGFANALHVLSLRGYKVFHVIPSWVDGSFALITASATTNLLGWSNVVHGEGPVSSSRSQIKENPNAVNKEESIESQGVSMGSQPLSEYSSPDDVMPVQHGDLASLKGQLVKLLESFNGELSLSCLVSEYQKSFKKHLRVSDYKASKLVDLLKKISDVISVEGKFVKLIK